MKLSPMLRTVAACALVAPWSYPLQANTLYSWHTRYNLTLPRLSTRSYIAAGVLLGSLGIGYYYYKTYLQKPKLIQERSAQKQYRVRFQDNIKPYVDSDSAGYSGDSETEYESLRTPQQSYDTNYQTLCLQAFDLLCKETMFLVKAINTIKIADVATVLEQNTRTIDYLSYTYGRYRGFLDTTSRIHNTQKIITGKIAQNHHLATLPWGIIIAKTADNTAISINLNNQTYTIY